MISIIRGREGPRSTVVRFHCADRVTARREIDRFSQMILPPGHVLDEEHIVSGRDASNPRPGRRVNVTLVLFQNDSREPTIDFDDLRGNVIRLLDAA